MINLTTIIQKEIQTHSNAGKLLRFEETGTVVDKSHSGCRITWVEAHGIVMNVCFGLELSVTLVSEVTTGLHCKEK
jgi:hypothetical protein